MLPILERKGNATALELRCIDRQEHFQDPARFIEAGDRLLVGFDRPKEIRDQQLDVRRGIRS